MAWQKAAAVFATGSPLESRFGQVAELPGDVGGERQHEHLRQAALGSEMTEEQPAEQQGPSD